MKKILIMLLIAALVLTGLASCKNKDIADEATPSPTASAEPTKVPAKMPELPDLDFEGLKFFEDGYEIVEYKGLSDGDTATFVVNKLPTDTRFLAIDTPEMNSSTDGQQPWAAAAKEFTKNALENAETIILEMDENSDIFDNYSRLLAWVWVDGKLLNYMLVEEGLAYVKYLYGDYKYTVDMIKIESETQKKDIKIWGEEDPDYDYENKAKEVTIADARALPRGSNVIITAVVTNKIDKNAFIQDESGAIYIYANRYNYSALVPGNEVTLTAKVTEYNGLLELTDIEDKKITKVSDGHVTEPKLITLEEVGEDIESMYIRINNLEVTEIVTIEGEKGYDVHVKDGVSKGVVRVDKYLNPYIEPEYFSVGMTFDVIGNIGQYGDVHQIMISGTEAILDGSPPQ